MAGSLNIGIHIIRGLDHKICELKLHLAEHNIDILSINELITTKRTYFHTEIGSYQIRHPDPLTRRGVGHVYKTNLPIEPLPEIIPTTITKNLNQAITINKYRTYPNSNSILPQSQPKR